MSNNEKMYDNRLGIIGWLGGGRWGIERYLYIIHRLAGVGVLIFFILHIFEGNLRIFGPEIWNPVMKVMEHPVFEVGELFIIIGFAFHALNGIRLILIELGWAVGKAEEPVYPYKSSLNTQRPLMAIMFLLAILLILAGGFDLMFLGH